METEETWILCNLILNFTLTSHTNSLKTTWLDVNNKILYWEKFSRGEIFAIWPNRNFFLLCGDLFLQILAENTWILCNLILNFTLTFRTNSLKTTGLDVNNKILYWEKFSRGEIFAIWPNRKIFLLCGDLILQMSTYLIFRGDLVSQIF